ncbi:AAA family ATPase [Stutzerimonas sp. R75]|uniref:AAA family ATPase n=1 Tax=Stutzerimonas sp. R75 TaxID=3439498 RepID=UPI00406C39F6
MKLRHAKIKNFRLLADVQLALEDLTTVVVGRNNSGKTSLSEIIRRLLAEGSAAFQLEDFSSACYDRFCTRVCKNIPVNPCYDFRESHRKGRP